MADLNELLEEAATRSNELADEADAAMTAIDDMVSQASDMSSQLETAAQHATSLLRDITALLTKTEADVEQGRSAVASGMQHLAAEAGTLKTHVEQLLASVKNGVAELAQHDAQSAAALDQVAQSFDGEVKELGQTQQELADAVEQDLQDASEAIAAFRTAVDEARAEYVHKQDEWRAAVDALEVGAQEQARFFTEGLDRLLAGHARALLDAANHLIERHNETMDHVGTRLGEESPRALEEALGPLTGVLETVVEQATNSKDQISARAAELLQEVRAALPQLEALQAAFQATEAL